MSDLNYNRASRYDPDDKKEIHQYNPASFFSNISFFWGIFFLSIQKTKK